MAKKKKVIEEERSSARRSGKPEIEMGQRIRLRRVEVGISQQELGTKLGVSFQQVQKYEKGVNRVGAARIEQIAKVLDVPVTYFFGDGQEGQGINSTKHQSEIESLLFLDSKFTLRLLRAYTAIDDLVVQRHFVALMETVAGIGNAEE